MSNAIIGPTLLELVFWACVIGVVYTYVVYPLCLAAVLRLRRKAVRVGGVRPSSVSIVLAAYNEEPTIGRRLHELTCLLVESGVAGEIIVVSDGSTDGTAIIARGFSKGLVRVLELPTNLGKAVALSQGCAAARHEIIAFADARQTWAPDALEKLLEPFTDPTVGAVSGDLLLGHGDGALAGVGMYWRYEKSVRRLESRFHSMISVTGAISAVRRELFHPIPRGTILDDMYWPLQVVLHGYRVVHSEGARAYDRLPERPRDEFRRKVRTLSGNFQLFCRLPQALLPWRNPVWFQLISHKVLRLLVPWALLAMPLLAASLERADYQFFFWCQVGFYAAAVAGICGGFMTRLRLVAAATSFVILNTAAWLAFWVWVSGRTGRTWGKVVYDFTHPQAAGKPLDLGVEGGAASL